MMKMGRLSTPRTQATLQRYKRELGVLCGRIQADIHALAEAVQKAGHEA